MSIRVSFSTAVKVNGLNELIRDLGKKHLEIESEKKLVKNFLINKINGSDFNDDGSNQITFAEKVFLNHLEGLNKNRINVFGLGERLFTDSLLGIVATLFNITNANELSTFCQELATYSGNTIAATHIENCLKNILDKRQNITRKYGVILNKYINNKMTLQQIENKTRNIAKEIQQESEKECKKIDTILTGPLKEVNEEVNNILDTKLAAVEDSGIIETEKKSKDEILSQIKTINEGLDRLQSNLAGFSKLEKYTPKISGLDHDIANYIASLYTVAKEHAELIKNHSCLSSQLQPNEVAVKLNELDKRLTATKEQMRSLSSRLRSFIPQPEIQNSNFRRLANTNLTLEDAAAADTYILPERWINSQDWQNVLAYIGFDELCEAQLKCLNEVEKILAGNIQAVEREFTSDSLRTITSETVRKLASLNDSKISEIRNALIDSRQSFHSLHQKIKSHFAEIAKECNIISRSTSELIDISNVNPILESVSRTIIENISELIDEQDDKALYCKQGTYNLYAIFEKCKSLDPITNPNQQEKYNIYINLKEMFSSPESFKGSFIHKEELYAHLKNTVLKPLFNLAANIRTDHLNLFKYNQELMIFQEELKKFSEWLDKVNQVIANTDPQQCANQELVNLFSDDKVKNWTALGLISSERFLQLKNIVLTHINLVQQLHKFSISSEGVNLISECNRAAEIVQLNAEANILKENFQSLAHATEVTTDNSISFLTEMKKIVNGSELADDAENNFTEDSNHFLQNIKNFYKVMTSTYLDYFSNAKGFKLALFDYELFARKSSARFSLKSKVEVLIILNHQLANFYNEIYVQRLRENKLTQAINNYASGLGIDTNELESNISDKLPRLLCGYSATHNCNFDFLLDIVINGFNALDEILTGKNSKREEFDESKEKIINLALLLYAIKNNVKFESVARDNVVDKAQKANEKLKNAYSNFKGELPENYKKPVKLILTLGDNFATKSVSPLNGIESYLKQLENFSINGIEDLSNQYKTKTITDHEELNNYLKTLM